MTGLTRSGRLRSRSAKAARSDEGNDEARAAVFARDGGCLLRSFGGRVPLAPGMTILVGRCAFEPRTFHHLRKDGQGGGYTVENGVTLCAWHNDWVEDHPGDARLLGLSVAKGIDHAEAARRRAMLGLT